MVFCEDLTACDDFQVGTPGEAESGIYGSLV